MAPRDPNYRGPTDTMQTPSSTTPNDRGTVSSAVDKAKDTTSQAIDKAQEAAGPAVSQVKDSAGQMVGQVKDTAVSQIEDRKTQAADSLGDVADTLRQTSQQLQQTNAQPLAGAADMAADRVEQFSNYLRDRNVNDIVADVEDFAREQPVLFISAAFALGLVAARFLKSSASRVQEDYGYNGGNGDYMAGQGYGTQTRYGAQQSYGRGANRQDRTRYDTGTTSMVYRGDLPDIE
ncbi:MAG: hypothetical protein U0822_21820 [Anaerolineae bacterium]